MKLNNIRPNYPDHPLCTSNYSLTFLNSNIIRTLLKKWHSALECNLVYIHFTWHSGALLTRWQITELLQVHGTKWYKNSPSKEGVLTAFHFLPYTERRIFLNRNDHLDTICCETLNFHSSGCVTVYESHN